MQQLAPDVWQIPLAPRHGVNAYMIGDVLVDAGIKQIAGRLVERLKGRGLTAHTLTHAHVDHAGGSKVVCERLGLPMWAPAGDVEAVESGRPPMGAGGSKLKPVLELYGRFPGTRVDRRLTAREEVAGFTVLDTPGHSPGHISFWRASDRVLICGDVFFDLNPFTLQYGLHHPPSFFNVDTERNRQSQRELADVEPELVCFGHGPPLRGAAPKLRDFVAKR